MALLFVSGCVSVSVGGKAPQKSMGVDYKAPGSPFQSLSQTPADGAWQNKGNGNTISFHSSCNDPADPTLDTVMRELFSGMPNLRTHRSRHGRFNGRESLDTEVEGNVDGILTRIRALVFKKNDCTYTLTYIGVPASFESDRAVFDEFLRNFSAP